MQSNVITNYHDAIIETDRRKAFETVEMALNNGSTPEEIVFDLVVPEIELMIRSFAQDKNVSLAQHFLASQIAEEITGKMLPLFSKKPKCEGRIVIGSAAGDFHGLGKKIVSGCLRARMFEVTDLGINVPAERFVDEAVSAGAQVIGVSSMMVHTALGDDGPTKVRRLLDERGLSNRIKLIVGGAPYRFDPELYKKAGANDFAVDGFSATEKIAALVSGVAK